jgi:hypothetical protein
MQESGPITTETSKSDGRLKDSLFSSKRKFLKSIIKKKKDGRGGSGKIKKLSLPSASSTAKSLIKKTSFGGALKSFKTSKLKSPKLKTIKLKKLSLKTKLKNII